MALQYVGGTKDGATGGSKVIDLTNLTGGIGSAPQAGDIVIVAVGAGYGGTDTLGVTGYTAIGTQQDANDTEDAHLFVAYKIMTATPDTSVTITAAGGAIVRGVVHVWRGVDQTTPLDVASTGATGTDSSLANPPTITPVTAGAIVLAVGAGADDDPFTSFTNAPTGYGNTVEDHTLYGSSATDSIVAIASKAWSGSGAEDPGAFAWVGSSSSDSWCGRTIALRPSTNTNYTKDLTETVTLVENVLKMPGKNLLEAVTLVENVLKQPQKVLLEAITLVETNLRQTGKNFLETITLAETFSRLSTSLRSFTETITLVEVFDVTLIFTRAFTETIELIETTTAKITAKVLTEIATLTDNVNTMATMFRQLLETITLEATIANVSTIFRSFTETIALVEKDIVRATGKVITETLALQEIFSRMLIYGRSFTETITLAEVFTKLRTHIRAFTETITLVPSIFRLPNKHLTETITLTARFRGLLNGKSIEYIQKYINQAGDYIQKYTDQAAAYIEKYTNQAGTYIKKYLDIP